MAVCVISNANEYDFSISHGADADRREVTPQPGGAASDVHADNTPINPVAVVPANGDANLKRSQIWSFLPAPPQLPLKDGEYQIFNSRTGTVLDLADGGDNTAGSHTH